MKGRILSLILIAMVLLAPLVRAAGPGGETHYRFVRIAESSSEDVEFGFPVINNRGQVASYVTTTRETEGDFVSSTEVFRSDGRRRTTIARRSDLSFLGSLAINDRGDVAFPAMLESGEEVIFRGFRSLTTIARTGRGVFKFFTFAVSINDRGQVGFGADLENGDEGIFLGRGGRVRPIYLASTSPLSGNPKPSLNDRGQVGFATYIGESEGVFIWDDGRIITVADVSSSPLFQIFSDVSLNNRAEVAFTATADNPSDPTQPGPLSLFAGRAGQLRRIADTTGTFSDFRGNPTINDRGQVAFVAESATGEGELPTALFVANGEQLVRVIGTGDELHGSRVVSVHLADDRTLNNRGQLAFGAHLEDGRFGVYRADPRRI